MATKRAHPLEEYLPTELVTWLRADTEQWGTNEDTHTQMYKQGTPLRHNTSHIGHAGFRELRDAWNGVTPWEPVIPLIEPWITTQTQIQIAAQGAYERLLSVAPARDEDGNIAAWFPTWWAEILLSRPWDERLGDAVIEATAYYLAHTP